MIILAVYLDDGFGNDIRIGADRIKIVGPQYGYQGLFSLRDCFFDGFTLVCFSAQQGKIVSGNCADFMPFDVTGNYGVFLNRQFTGLFVSRNMIALFHNSPFR